MSTIQFPLNEVQVSLLRLTENLPDQDLQVLKNSLLPLKPNALPN